MNEGTKTGVFWGIAIVMMVIAAIVAWPKSTDEPDTIAGRQLFEDFTDPLAAANMKIVTFDEEQGTLDTFEVRKERETQLWTIPSRDGYPADALEQMKDAANALVGLKILDIQTSNAEDHDDLGVAEPKLEDLEVGDEGVGRLVSFKDQSQETLASLIIGDAVKDDPEKRYVRIPGQDPVYVVKLDESPLTTNFQDWIEDDLLQLSSIDISDMEIKDYSASLGPGGQISLTRNYAATVELDGSQWKLKDLIEFDPKNPLADPTPVQVGDDQELNKTKLDAMKNALDDLKIADVVRKPEGMSATLRANQDLLSDKDAVGSLAQRGFYPVPSGPQGEVEILSANGELSVALGDGVKYIMRFGNIAGVSNRGDSSTSGDDGDDSDEVDTGVNRYLLVTTMVDESKFPPPELKPVPQTLEDLEELLRPKQPEPTDDAGEGDTEPDTDGGSEGEPSDDNDTPAESTPETTPGDDDAPETSDDAADEPASQEPAESSQEQEVNAPSETSGESESTGSGEASGSGQAQQEDSTPENSTEQQDSTEQQNAVAEATEEAAEKDSSPQDAATSDGPETPESSSEADQADKKPDPKPETPADEELTQEEKMERLEAEQEKITKENQRKLDARKDRIEEAERRVRDLNARFADWYYVIPEDTYSQLRIKRDELFQSADEAALETDAPPIGTPQFNFPGVPGN